MLVVKDASTSKSGRSAAHRRRYIGLKMLDHEIGYASLVDILTMLISTVCIAFGIFLMYSAIKGISAIMPEGYEQRSFLVRYYLRGIIGFGFILSGLYSFYTVPDYLF